VGACNPDWDPRARGVIYGLTPHSTRHHIYKAIYEGIACELSANVRVLEGIVGPFGEVRISGGTASSPFANQLRADLSGKVFRALADPETVCRGAAILAGLAAGIYADAEEAVSAVVRIGRAYAPDTESARLYDRQKRQYGLLYGSLGEIRST
jgi:xylulokinase